MPKYRNIGTSEVQYGTTKVNPGDIVDASFSPGKQFVLVEDPPALSGSAPAPKKKEVPTIAQTTGE